MSVRQVVLCAFWLLYPALAVAQDSAEQRSRAMVGLTTQLNEALSQEAQLNAKTVQLQRFRSESMTLLSRLSQRKDAWPATGLTALDVRSRALSRYIESDLALNIDAVNDQLAALDTVRARIPKLNDAVEATRSAMVMEGQASRADLSGGATGLVQRSPDLPLPEGVYTQAQSDFRAFPKKDEAIRTKPLVLPLKQAELSFAFEQDDPDDPAKLYHKGVQLLTPLGATVYAPFEGEIAYAAPYRSFGNLVVIEHEGEGATLLSGLHSFAISVGDWVSQGAPLGLMSEQETPTPRLYFEFRIDQTPVDPLALVGSITNE